MRNRSSNLIDNASMFFGDVRNGQVYPGIRHDLINDAGFSLPGIFVGDRYSKNKKEKVVPIPVDPRDKPLIGREKIFAGSIGEQPVGESDEMRMVLRAPKDGENLVLFRTGFRRDPDSGILNDLIAVQQETGGKIFEHDAFSFHREEDGSKVLVDASGVSLSQTPEAAQLGQALMGKVAATKVKGFAPEDDRRSNVLKVPRYKYIFFYMPWESIVLARCVNGNLMRVVSEPHRVRPIDAPDGLHDFFDMLYAAHNGKLIKPKKKAPAAVELLVVEKAGLTSHVATKPKATGEGGQKQDKPRRERVKKSPATSTRNKRRGAGESAAASG